MSRLKRYPASGNLYFVTTVTAGRQPILTDNCHLLRDAVETARRRIAFEEIAWVILPDHYHGLLEVIDADISKIMQVIKMSFSSKYRKVKGLKEGHIWQRRFWDHIIRDQKDLNGHIDYIHYNPVKHGCALSPNDYPFSSFDCYYKEGLYQSDWGRRGEFKFEGDFGE